MTINHKENITLLALISLVMISGCVLVLPNVSADTDTVDVITITVPSSCSISATGNNSHTAEISNGQTNSSVGESTIKAYCNDSNGFSIYAIGFTNDTYGSNVLTSSALGSSHDITTGINTTGNSSWAMKLSTITSPTPTYPIIIAGSEADTDKEQGDPDYTSFQEVPDDYTLVAKRTSSTDTGENAEGATLKTTYQVHISNTQSAGTYTGQVKYVMIHPYNDAAPRKPATFTWQESTATNPVDEDIEIFFQDFDAATCNSGTTGQVGWLKDSRDNQVYKIAKLANGKCWTLDNLRLDLTNSTVLNSLTASNTHASATSIVSLKNGNRDAGDQYANGTFATWNDLDNTKSYSVAKAFANYRNGTTISYGAGSGKNGVYYNYCAASAGSYCYGDGTNSGTPLLGTATEDICPAGWRMPTSVEYQALFGYYNATATNTDSIQYNLSTPLSGSFAGTMYNYEYYGFFWSSSRGDNMNMRSLYVADDDFDIQNKKRDEGLPMRCIFGS